MRSGGLFAGYGGLDMAIAEVFGAEPGWFSEIDDAPSKILAHHWPGIPNLGDITKVDWDAVEPVDILGGGFPCQDVSAAGKRAGIRPGNRSGLWNHMAYAISKIRPRYVVVENVRGLLSAEAHSDVEPCPWCLGDGPGEPALRALGAVLGDLAELGYDAQWCGVRAADIGAPHGRYRIFVLAADTRRECGERWSAALAGGFGDRKSPSEHQRPAASTTHPDHAGRQQHCRAIPARAEFAAAEHSGHFVADTDSHAVREQPVAESRSSGAPVARLAGDTAANPDGDGLALFRGQQPVQRDAHGRGGQDTAWGPYEPAIRRWEAILGRLAPAPTEAGAKGAQRLSPRFVEFMMGLPAGHVTAVPGVNRNAQLKALGNGVVPQQAVAALRHMTSRMEVAA